VTIRRFLFNDLNGSVGPVPFKKEICFSRAGYPVVVRSRQSPFSRCSLLSDGHTFPASFSPDGPQGLVLRLRAFSPPLGITPSPSSRLDARSTRDPSLRRGRSVREDRTTLLSFLVRRRFFPHFSFLLRFPVTDGRPVMAQLVRRLPQQARLPLFPAGCQAFPYDFSCRLFRCGCSGPFCSFRLSWPKESPLPASLRFYKLGDLLPSDGTFGRRRG